MHAMNLVQFGALVARRYNLYGACPMLKVVFCTPVISYTVTLKTGIAIGNSILIDFFPHDFDVLSVSVAERQFGPAEVFRVMSAFFCSMSDRPLL